MYRITVEAILPDSTTRIATGFVFCSHGDRLNDSEPALWALGLGVEPLARHVPLLNCKHIIWISCHMVGRREKQKELHSPKIVDPFAPLDQEVSCLPGTSKPLPPSWAAGAGRAQQQQQVW